MLTNILTFVLLSLSPISATDMSSTQSRGDGVVPIAELEIQGHYVKVKNRTDVQQCSLNDTCSYYTPIRQLLDIRDREERLKFIEDNGIKVEHSFLNNASERFLYIENYHATSELIAGKVGAAKLSTVHNNEDRFLQLKENACPDQSNQESSTCYAIENGFGRLYAMNFKAVPYVLSFGKGSFSDAWVEGIFVVDSTRFETVSSSGLWVLENTNGLDSATVSIRNVGTGRRLFADKTDRFGGSPGDQDDPISDDQMWRHCIQYLHDGDRIVDCPTHI